MSAFAADTAKGSITIKDPTTSDATVAGKTFEIYQIFYATTDGSNISYSWYADKDNPQANPFYEFFAAIKTSDGKNLVTSGKAASEYDNIQTVVNYISTNYTTNYELSKFAEQIHEYIVDNVIDYVASKKADTSDKQVVFDGLDYGYYLVYDATDLKETKSAVRSAIMVDTVNSDIEITLKANRPELEKKVLENDGVTYGEATSSSIGETVTFKITTYIPSHEYYDSYKYYIKDTLPEGLTLDSTSVSIGIDSAAVTEENLKEYCTHDSEGNTLTVTLTEKALTGSDKLATDTKIEIVYTATVNGNIARGRNTNTATLYYSNDPKDTDNEGSIDDSAYVYTYMFVLSKFAIDTTGNVSATARLAGAQFKIYSVDKDGNKTLMKFSEQTNPETQKTMYVVGGDIEELTVLDGAAPTSQITNASYFGGNLGDITIFGLKEGNYYIEETKAPDGYVLPTDGFEFTLSDTIDANGNVSTLNATVGEHSSTGAIGNYGADSANYLSWMDIGNAAGSKLPETGGMGTVLFTVAGIVLMAGALAFFISRKRGSAV